MKILIIDNGATGKANDKHFIARHTAHFCEELVSAGLDVGHLQFEKIINSNEDILDCSLDDRVKSHLVTLDVIGGKLGKIISYFKITLLMLKTFKKYDFIYIFYPGHTPVIASCICLLFGKRYSLYIRGQYGLDNVLGHFIVKRAEFCLTVSDILKEKLLKFNQNAEIIAPMIDFSKKDILLERDYRLDSVRCLFVGRIELRKGIYDLIDAIEILNREVDNLYFDIVGGGESFDYVKERMKNYYNVVLHGRISEKEKLLSMYRQADVFIFPSHDEGFPRVLYEAMMARVPVITTMVGGIGGFMKDSHNCLAIESQSPKSIVKVVKKMIDSKELRMQLVEQATKDVLKLFDGTRKKHSELLIDKLGFKNEKNSD